MAPEKRQPPSTPQITEAALVNEMFKRFEFSARDRESLRDAGMLILPLSGQSINQLKENGMRLREVHVPKPLEKKILESQSRFCEVAMDPHNFLLAKSNDLTLPEQEEMIKALQKQYTEKGMDVEVVKGSIADIAAINFAYFGKTGRYLLGESKYQYREIRTAPIDDKHVSHAVTFCLGDVLQVRNVDKDYFYNRLYVAPLVVPTSRKK